MSGSSTDLQYKVGLILSQARTSDPHFVITGTPPPAYDASDILPLGLFKVDCEQLQMLRVLFDAGGTIERADILALVADRAALYDVAAGVAVAFLIERRAYSSVQSLLERLIAGRDGQLFPNGPTVASYGFAALVRILQAESHRFTEDDLTSLSAAIANIRIMSNTEQLHLLKYQRSVLDLVTRIRYLRLRSDLLEGINPEINTDQLTVSDRAAKMGFSPALQRTLPEINKQLYRASSGIDFKQCLELMRTALEGFAKESCQAIESKTGKTLNTGEKSFQPLLQYLTNAGAILKSEVDALQKFYNLLANEGSHSLEAEAEQARVYKNLTIEWLLLISGRVQGCLK